MVVPSLLLYYLISCEDSIRCIYIYIYIYIYIHIFKGLTPVRLPPWQTPNRFLNNSPTDEVGMHRGAILASVIVENRIEIPSQTRSDRLRCRKSSQASFMELVSQCLYLNPRLLGWSEGIQRRLPPGWSNICLRGSRRFPGAQLSFIIRASPTLSIPWYYCSCALFSFWQQRLLHTNKKRSRRFLLPLILWRVCVCVLGCVWHAVITINQRFACHLRATFLGGLCFWFRAKRT